MLYKIWYPGKYTERRVDKFSNIIRRLLWFEGPWDSDFISFSPVFLLLSPIAASHKPWARGYPGKLFKITHMNHSFINWSLSLSVYKSITGLKSSSRDSWEEGAWQPIKHDDVHVTFYSDGHQSCQKWGRHMRGKHDCVPHLSLRSHPISANGCPQKQDIDLEIPIDATQNV